jgi:hypothetical protein
MTESGRKLAMTLSTVQRAFVAPPSEIEQLPNLAGFLELASSSSARRVRITWQQVFHRSWPVSDCQPWFIAFRKRRSRLTSMREWLLRSRPIYLEARFRTSWA